MITLEFLITSLIVVLIPGTGVVFTVSAGLVQGKRASLFASLGCTLGIVPHLLATVLGLAAVMHTSALAFQLLKYAGVAYLLYLAIATWRDRSAFVVQEGGARRSALSLTVKAFLLNILNPKLTIFFLAFLPQFVDPAATSPLGQLLLLSGVFMADDLRRLRALRPARARLPPRGHRLAARAGLAAPRLLRRLRRPGRATRVHRTLTHRAHSTSRCT
ncbi:LysE family translocator [Hydrogenophaga sp. UC242_50]|uniref:LysE family translocator n=1 Tax=Hydrogenophaga sp. UC242_50 TaxID=3350169 RepID=UPI0036D2B1EA